MSQTNWNSLGAFLASKKRQERESTSQDNEDLEKETPEPASPRSHEGQIPTEAPPSSAPSAPGAPPSENILPIPAAAQQPSSKPSSGQPVNHPVNQTVNQLTNLVNQLTTQNDHELSSTLLVNQSTSQPVNQIENAYKSRRERRLKGIRLPLEKLQHYEEWCFRNNRMDFQDAVEKALDWLTSQPVNQLTTLINNDLNNYDNKLLRIITLYKTLSKRKDFTERDREAYYEIAHHDEDVIVSLMAATHSRKKAETPINGFRYFTTAIQKATAGREVGQSAPALATNTGNKTSDMPVAPEDLEIFRKAGGKFEGEV